MVITLTVVSAVIFLPNKYNIDSGTNVDSERNELIDGIESYWNQETLENHLRKKHVTWEVQRDREASPTESGLPYNYDKIVVKNYLHLGFAGELNIIIFYNRLIGVSFFPKNIDKYLEELTKHEHIDLINLRRGEKINLAPSIRIFIVEQDKNNSDNKVIRIENSVLLEQVNLVMNEQ